MYLPYVLARGEFVKGAGEGQDSTQQAEFRDDRSVGETEAGEERDGERLSQAQSRAQR